MRERLLRPNKKYYDIYYIYIDLDNKHTQILANDEIIEVDGFDFIKHINLSRSSLCFVNRTLFVKKFYPGGESSGDGYVRKDVNLNDPLFYDYGNAEFRSFGALITLQSMSVLREMFPNIPTVCAMREYVTGLGNPEKVSFTLAFNAMQGFYAPIKDDLWAERKDNHNYYFRKDGLKVYNDMLCGNKAGLLTDMGDKEERVCWYAENLLMFDKKSAYPSVLVSDNKFPIGRVQKIETNLTEYKIDIISNCIKKGEWFKVVIDGTDDYFSNWIDEDKMAFEYWDVKAVILTGAYDRLLKILKQKEFRVYITDKTGYLPRIFRDRIMQYYMNKERHPKGTFKRHLIKTTIDMLYGKGIQEHDFKSQSDIHNFYCGRGDHYLNPEMSNHCSSRVRYEMIKAVMNTDAFYWDTDGIKVQDTPEARAYFEAENKKLSKANCDAGYDSNIGLWDFEGKADRFVLFAPKFYAYECDGKIEAKTAGMSKELYKTIYGGVDYDLIDYWRHNGFQFVSKVYDINGWKVDILYEHSILKGDLQ